MATTTAASATDIQTLYVAYFNRPADPLGLQAWQNQGSSMAQIAAGFSASQEYKDTYGGKTPLDLVDSIYMNLFGRHAEAAGLLYWAGKLQAGTETFASIVLTIAGAAQNDDLTAINNKVAAAAAFTASLTSGDAIRGYDGAAANAVAKTWLASITTDDSFTANTTADAMAAVAAKATAAHDAAVNPPTVTTLTNSVDKVVGGAGNDVFNALPDSNGNATLTALDSIDGGAGINTLNVVDTAAAATPYSVPTTVSVKNVQNVNVTSANNTVTADVSGWTGATQLTVGSKGGSTLTAATTTAVSATDAALAGGSISVTGGSDVTVSALASTHASTIAVSGAAGNVSVTTAEKEAGTNTFGTITVTGGKTVSVTQNATASAAAATAATLTQGNVSVTGDANTTAVTVNQAAAAAAAGVVKEVFTATFTAGAGANTDTVTFDSIAYTASGALSAINTAAAFVTFYNAQAGANWVAVNNGDATVTFTKKTAGVVADVVTGDFVISGGGATVAVTAAAPTTQGTSSQAIVDGAVTIADANAGSATKAATISSVTLANYGASTVSSNALSKLNLSGTGGTLSLTSGLTTETVKALALTVNNLTAGAISDTSNHFTTINVTTAGKDSTIANINDTAATALTVAGTNGLTLTSISGLSNLKTVTVSGAAGLSADVSGLGAITDVNAAASSGANTVTLNNSTTYEGGSGVDTVKLTTAAGVKVDGGAGSADVLNLAGAAGTLLTAGTAANLVNFEVLDATGGTGTFDVSLLSGIKAVQVGADGGSSVTFANVAAGTTLSLLANPGHAVTYGLKTDTSTDALTLNLGTSKTAGISFVGGVTVGSIETVTINSNGTGTGTNSLALTDPAVTKLVVSGAESLTLTGLTGNTVTTVDATGVAKGSTFTLTTAATATAGATVTAGDANLVFTGAAASGKTDTIKAGNGDNTITETAGSNTVTLGNGTNTVSLTGAGNNTLTVGTGANTVTVGTGQNIVTFGAHAAGTVDSLTVGVATSANTYTTVTGLQHGDTLVLDNTANTVQFAGAAHTVASAKISLNNSTALFADYIAQASSGDGSAHGLISWFQFGGNTYIVDDVSASSSFVAGADNIVKLVGLVDLGATGAAAVIAAHGITL